MFHCSLAASVEADPASSLLEKAEEAAPVDRLQVQHRLPAINSLLRRLDRSPYVPSLLFLNESYLTCLLQPSSSATPSLSTALCARASNGGCASWHPGGGQRASSSTHRYTYTLPARIPHTTLDNALSNLSMDKLALSLSLRLSFPSAPSFPHPLSPLLSHLRPSTWLTLSS